MRSRVAGCACSSGGSRPRPGTSCCCSATRPRSAPIPISPTAGLAGGADLRIEAPGRAERRTLLGVLDAATDALLVRTSASKRSADFIALLGDLDRRYGPAAAAGPGKPVVLVLDHGSIHTGRASRAALETRQSWLTVEWLPTYAPELNPIERRWRDLKRHYLANQTCRDVEPLDRRLHAAVRQRNLDRAHHVWPNLPEAALHPASQAAFGGRAIPGCRRGRCRRRWPQTKGCRCAFQYAVASSTARTISAQLSNRRPLRASERSTFHHGSIRLR